MASPLTMPGNDRANEHEDLADLPAFVGDPPLIVCADPSSYSGDFPHDDEPSTAEGLRHTCTKEIPMCRQEELFNDPKAPPWFRTKKQKPLFYELLGEGDFESAWLSLNSNGWSFADARQALTDLVTESQKPGLDLLLQAWGSYDHERFGGY